jgi:hypothetical protein
VRRVAAAALLAALLAACSQAPAAERGTTGPASRATPSPTGDVAPATAEESTDVDAALEGASVEAPRTRFAGRIVPVPAALEREMRGTTWTPGCPVPIADLRVLRFNYWGFDGEVKRGPMVVNASVAEDVLWVFRQLFEAGFPLKRVGLAREFVESRLETHPDTRRSVTASFNCRVVVTPAGAGDEYSQHAYGLAVDLNPLQNPYVAEDGWVRNRFARPYVDRSRHAPGMIHEGDVVVRAFDAIGWAWGGRWSGGKDYMHFSAAGT